MRPLPVFLALGIVLCSSAAPRALSQQAGLLPEWTLDEDGLRQWKHVEVPCSACSGSLDDSTCHACGDTGVQYDPLVEMICAYCDGSALWECRNCFGAGSYHPQGSGKKGQKCGSCDATGSIDCEACKGKRRIAVVKMGRGGPGKASAKQLRKARETLTEAIRALGAFRPIGRESKDRKTLYKAIDKAAKTLQALKDAKKLLDAGLKGLRVSAQYLGYEGWIADEFRAVRDRSIDLMEHQVRLLKACEERLEFNEQVLERK